MVKNSAFLFIKPHAVTDKVKELVKETLEKKEITIAKEGSIDGAEIDKRKLVDQHYYSIASKATLQKPGDLNVPKEKFKDFFGVDFDAMLKEGKVMNAKDAAEKMQVDAAKLDSMWATCKAEKKLIKFGGGFYCAEMGEDPLYVFNGFFMSMRDKFVREGASIYYYVVEWDSKTCPWEDFRGKVLGPTDPTTAPADSLRGLIWKDWEALGLKAVPNVGDNGVHASASPFEALCERINWLGYRVDRDPFGKLALKAGCSRSLIKAWSLDPQVTYGTLPITRSIFDTLEDLDSDECLARMQMIAIFASDKDAKKESALEKEVETLRTQLKMYEDLAKAVTLVQEFAPPADPKPAAGKGKGKGGGKGSEKKKGEGKGADKDKGKGKDSAKPKKKKGKKGE